MTKKFLCILLSLICAIQVFSQEVDEKIAQIVAENFFYNTFKGGYRVKDSIHFVDVDNLQIQSINTKSVNGLNKYHIINFKEGGWVIVSGNKGVGPIFMYSEQGHLGQDESFPDVFKEWLFLFEESVDSANKTNFIPKEKQEKWYNFENNIFKTDSNEGNKLKRSDFSDGSAFYLLDSKWGTVRS